MTILNDWHAFSDIPLAAFSGKEIKCERWNITEKLSHSQLPLHSALSISEWYDNGIF